MTFFRRMVAEVRASRARKRHRRAERQARAGVAWVKRQNSEELARRFDHRVGYGPFKGMRLPEHSWWSPYDTGSKLLGAYEAHVTERICQLADASR